MDLGLNGAVAVSPCQIAVCTSVCCIFAARGIKMRQLKVMPISASSLARLPVPAPAVAAVPTVPRLRLPKLCVSLGGATPAELFGKAEAALADARFFEFRLDALAKPAAALPQLRDFLNRHRDVISIATCRRKEHGGGFTGSLAGELDILLKAA